MRRHRRHGLGHLGIRPALHQAQVELDDVGRNERQQGEGARVCPDVVERDAPSPLSRRRDGVKDVRGPGRQRALGDLEHDPQPAGRPPLDLGVACRRRQPEGLGLDVHEQPRPLVEAHVERPLERGDTAGPVELGGAALAARSVEQHRRRLEDGSCRTPGEGLERHGLHRVEIDDRLVHAAQRARGDHFLEGFRGPVERGSASAPELCPD